MPHKSKSTIPEPECIAKYKEDVDGLFKAFMDAVPPTVEKCKKMALLVRAHNPKQPQTPKLKADIERVASESNFEAAAPPVSRPGGMVLNPDFPDNSSILERLHELKIMAYDLRMLFDGLQDWILVRLPALGIEDDTGSQVQAAVLAQIAEFNKTIKESYGEEYDYLNGRGEIETKILKQPKNESARKALLDHDLSEWDSIALAYRSIARAMVLTHDLLVKNMERLQEPTRERHSMMMM